MCDDHSGLCPTPGANEAITKVTAEFDNNNDGVELRGQIHQPIVTEDA